MGRGECKALLSANISELRENKDGENSESCAVKSFPEVRVWEGGRVKRKKFHSYVELSSARFFPFYLFLSFPLLFRSPRPNLIRQL